MTPVLLTANVTAEVRVPSRKVSFEMAQDAKQQNSSVIWLDER